MNPSKKRPTQKDIKEIALFRRYLSSLKKYGIKKMIKHRYWRTYLGLGESE